VQRCEAVVTFWRVSEQKLYDLSASPYLLASQPTPFGESTLESTSDMFLKHGRIVFS
jgi:hypothetical protein